jgi:hypothetical protein
MYSGEMLDEKDFQRKADAAFTLRRRYAGNPLGRSLDILVYAVFISAAV